MTTIGLNREKL